MTITATTGAFVLPGCLGAPTGIAATVAGARPRAVGHLDVVPSGATSSARDAVDVLAPVLIRPGGGDG
jgi:hypothetical protein